MTQIHDVAMIGAGAVGSAIARELSRYDMNVVLLEPNSDVGTGTSKASTAIWDTGYDATPSSLESVLLKRSYPLLEKFMMEGGSPFELPSRFRIRSHEFHEHKSLTVRQGHRVLHSQSFRRLPANTSIDVSSEWAQRADYSGEPLRIEVA